MQPEDFAEIEAAFTNVGRDIIWERQIGDHLIKLSPIPFPAQVKVNDALSNKELGNNVVIESKRVTLSYAIVGLDKFDLSKYCDAGPIFKIIGRDGKSVAVTLDRYIYEKLSSWGGQFIDDVFEVYADLVESHQKNNLKEIKFENLKDPNLELLELEEKVAELRRQLGKPQLIEKTTENKSDEDQENDEEELLNEESVSTGEGFDPFRALNDDTVTGPVQPTHFATKQSSVATLTEPPIDLNPPIPVISRSREIAESESGLTTSASPHIPSSLTNDDVIESRNPKGPHSVVVDVLPKQGVNPRFRKNA